MYRYLSSVIKSSILILPIIIFSFFSIGDIVNALPVYDDVNGAFTDDYAGTTGIATSAGAGVNTTTGKIQLRNASSTYTPPFNTTGYVKTVVIRPLKIAKWNTVNITGTFPAGTEVRLQVIDDGGTAYSDVHLIGNTAGIATFPVDISSVSPFIWANGDLGWKIPMIAFKFILSTTDTSITPEIDSLTLTWTTAQGDLTSSTFDDSVVLSSWIAGPKGFYASRYSNSEVYPAIRWAGSVGQYNMTAPAIYVFNNRLFAIEGWYNGRIYTMNKDTGAVIKQYPWSERKPGVVAQNGNLYGAFIGNDIMFSLDTENVSVNWVYNYKGGHGNSHVAIGKDKTLFNFYYNASSRINTLYAFDADSSIKWTRSYTNGEVGDIVDTSPISVADDGTLYYTYYSYNSSYVVTGHSKLVALNPSNGDVIWEYFLGNVQLDYINIGSDGTIYVHDYAYSKNRDIYLWAINPDGTLKWRKNYGTGDYGVSKIFIDNDGNLNVFYYYTGFNVKQFKYDPDGNELYYKDWGDYITPYQIDSSNGMLYTYYKNEEEETGLPTRLAYIDGSNTLRWEFLNKIVNPDPDLCWSGGGEFRWPVIDDRGWIYVGLESDCQDIDGWSIYDYVYAQSFAMAPWTLSLSTNASNLNLNETISFTLTTAMQRTNVLFGGDNKLQVVIDNGDKVLLTYDSTDSNGDTIWKGTYTVPSSMLSGNHSYTIEASQAYLETDTPVHFDTEAIYSSNTGITLTESFYVYPPERVIITDIGLISNVPVNDSLYYYFTSQYPVIKGTAEPLATVYFIANGHTYSVQADAVGNYVITIKDPALDKGENALTYYQINSAGSRSADRYLTLVIGVEYFPDWLIDKLFPPEEGDAVPSPTAVEEDTEDELDPGIGEEIVVPDTGEIIKTPILIIGPNGDPLGDTKVKFDDAEYITDGNGYIYPINIEAGSYNIVVELNGQVYTHELVLGANDLEGGSSIRLENTNNSIYLIIFSLCLILLVIILLLIYKRSKRDDKHE